MSDTEKEVNEKVILAKTFSNQNGISKTQNFKNLSSIVFFILRIFEGYSYQQQN